MLYRFQKSAVLWLLVVLEFIEQVKKIYPISLSSNGRYDSSKQA